MDFTSMVHEARTCRRFDASMPVSKESLDWLVDCARVVPSAANNQMLRYVTVLGKPSCDAFFPVLLWAGALKDWPGPIEVERPTGYIVMLTEKGKLDSRVHIDMGIAAQTIQLAAHSKGLGLCMFLSFKPDMLREVIALPEAYEVVLVMAVGVPVEKRVIVPLPANGKTTYYRDEAGVHYVPKRALEDILLYRV